MDLLTQLEQYVPWNEQEAEDREELLRRLRSGEDLYTRENRSAHLTASAWVVSPDRRQVLMAYHNLYNSWAWLGGHADGERDLLSAALREVREESGLRHVRPISDQIYSLEILTVDGHEKRGRYVPSHLHLNITYLLEASPAEAVRCKPDENSRVGWFPPEEVPGKNIQQAQCQAGGLPLKERQLPEKPPGTAAILINISSIVELPGRLQHIFNGNSIPFCRFI